MSNNVVYAALFWLLAVGCTSLRSNARLQPGVSGGVVLAGALVLAERGAGQPVGGPSPEGFVQIARTDGICSGTAIQLKVPLHVGYAAADVYRQFSGNDRWSHGGGLELGPQSGGGYYVVTGHTGSAYTTATARLISHWRDWQQRVLTAQMAFGRLGSTRHRRTDFYGFAAYNRAFGEGFDIGWDQSPPLRTWLLAGVGLRFF